MCVCACVRACVRACVSACVRAGECVCVGLRFPNHNRGVIYAPVTGATCVHAELSTRRREDAGGRYSGDSG